MTDGSGVVGGEDAADGGAFGPEGIECYELAVFCERLLELLPSATGLDGAGEVLPGMFKDAVETGEFEADICLGRIAPALFRVAAGGSDGEAVFVGVAEDL